MVFTVRVTVCAVAPLIATDAGMLHVGGSIAGVDVRAQLRFMTPVNPPEGAKLIVDVFPVIAPGTTLTLVPLREKSPGGGLMVNAADATALGT